MDWNAIGQDVVAGAITVILGALATLVLVPCLTRPRLKVKDIKQSGHWVHALVKCKRREAARNVSGYITLRTETLPRDLLPPPDDRSQRYFIMPDENATQPVQVSDALVHWAVRPNPTRAGIQPGTTALANIGLFHEKSFIVMSEEGYEGEDKEGKAKCGQQRMRLNTEGRRYEFEFYVSADNARRSNKKRFTVHETEITLDG